MSTLSPEEHAALVAGLDLALAKARAPGRAGPGRLTGCRVLSLRRSASRRRYPHPLHLSLEVTWHEAGNADGSAGTVRRQRLSGKSWRDGGSALALAEHAARAWAPPEAGPGMPPLIHLPALDMLLWAWPNDPALPQLPALMDAAHWPAGSGPVQALRHAPEDRATLRREGAWAKTFHDDRAGALHRRFRHFEQRATHEPDAPEVPATLAWSAGLRTLWQAHADGRPLVAGAPQAGDAAALGRALAQVHAAPVDLAEPRPADHLLVEIDRRRQKIGRVCPDLAPRVNRVADRLLARATTLPPGCPGVIHGDCHFDQFQRAPSGRVLMFDLDEMCWGDPMEDLAALFSREGVAAGWVAPLLDAYREAAPGRWCAERLRWQRAVHALLQASRAFVFQVADWPAAVDRRLRAVEDLL